MPIINDPGAVELTSKLTPLLQDSVCAHHQQLAAGLVDRQLAVYIAMRAARFDDYAADFIRRYPDAVVVNLGCGFDTRFFRIDNGSFTLFDLDLPETLQIKRRLLTENNRYQFIASSVADFAWMESVPHGDTPVLFLAEGLLMYLPPDIVHNLVLRLQAQFPGSELVAEVVNTLWLHPLLKWTIDLQLQHRHLFGKDATFRSGLSDSRDMEQWHDGIHFIDEWCALDQGEPKLGAARFLRFSDWFRKLLWVVHYRLDMPDNA
jgi:methyltransferase (TIGR00027 family)